jgi:hypothetical protein
MLIISDAANVIVQAAFQRNSTVANTVDWFLFFTLPSFTVETLIDVPAVASFNVCDRTQINIDVLCD